MLTSWYHQPWAVCQSQPAQHAAVSALVPNVPMHNMLKGADAAAALLAKTRCASPAPDPKRRRVVNDEMKEWKNRRMDE